MYDIFYNLVSRYNMEPLSFDENMSDTAESVLSQPFNQLKLSELDFRQMNQLDPYRWVLKKSLYYKL
jgi:hypothetical protein